MRPLFGNVLLEPIEHETTSGGFILPNNEEERVKEAIVIAIGSGSIVDSGIAIPMEVKVGDRVYYKATAPVEIKENGKRYLVTEQRNLLGVK